MAWCQLDIIDAFRYFRRENTEEGEKERIRNSIFHERLKLNARRFFPILQLSFSSSYQ